MQPSSLMIRSGLLIVDTNAGFPACRHRHRLSPDPQPTRRADCAGCCRAFFGGLRAGPLGDRAGRYGLAEWSLEGRLPGVKARRPVRGRLLTECLDFLTALHLARTSAPRRGAFVEQADLVASVCVPAEARAVRALADNLDMMLADAPRGFAHGDFFYGNLLVEGTSLTGVADWDAAGPGRLPLPISFISATRP